MPFTRSSQLSYAPICKPNLVRIIVIVVINCQDAIAPIFGGLANPLSYIVNTISKNYQGIGGMGGFP